MKAAYIQECGPPEKIIYGDVSDPVVGPGQVLVRTKAVSLNPIDTYIRNGANFWELPVPYIVGCDLAGVVEQVGPDVNRFQVGDRVWGSNQGLLGRQGTFAELCSVDEEWLYPTPDEVDDRAAAACSLVGITAHLGLLQNANLQSGETLFVQGGAGGVGSMVVQMAKALGARVITSAGSDEKVQLCKTLGADQAVNYNAVDVSSALSQLAPHGADVIWETQRDPDLDALVAGMAERGRLILMAGRDARPEFPVGPFYVKGCSIHGFVMFKASPEEQRKAADDINNWLAAGQLKPQIGKEMRLSEAAAAHRLQEQNTLNKSGTLTGKIVLTPDK